MTSERGRRSGGAGAGARATRRDVMGGMLAGGALVTMPAFLAGCGVQQATRPAAAAPANPFLAWFGIDEPALAGAFTALTAHGADLADIYFQHRRETRVELADGAVASTDVSILQGAGLRVVAGERTGYAVTEELTRPALERAARAAAEGVSGPAHKAPQHFVAGQGHGLTVIEMPWSDVAMDRRLEIIERLDHYARAAEPGADSVVISWSDVDERVLIATLDGRLVADQRPMTRLAIRISTIRDGRRESGFANIAARDDIEWYTDARLEGLALDAVGRASVRFEAGPAPTGEMPVILSAASSGILLHEAIGHAFEADFNREGISPYADRLGARIAADTLTLVDQGTLPRERGSLAVDDEGSDCRRIPLVEKGVLRSYLHDLNTARFYGTTTTGSGRRESYRFAPLPRMTCTFLENGPYDRDEIISGVERGVLAETYTTGRVALGRGDYTFDIATGWLVEQGRLTAPLKDFRLRGRGADTLERIARVANDARMDSGGWTCGKKGQRVPVSQGMPTVLVSSLEVGEGEPPSPRREG